MATLNYENSNKVDNRLKLCYHSKMIQKDIDRFWSKVNKGGECWVWRACKDKDGYGFLKIKEKTKKAHRVSWEIHNGPIPEGMLVCHSCDNPSCVNPGHLFLGTDKDNAIDKMKKGRAKGQKGEKNFGAKLTEGEVLKVKTLYSSGNYTQKELGYMFKVDRTQIQRILYGKAWKHLV